MFGSRVVLLVQLVVQPVATQPAPGTQPVATPVATQPAPVMQPVAMPPAPVTQPVATQPAPALQPGATQPAPVMQPVVTQPAPMVRPVTQPVATQPAPVTQPVAQPVHGPQYAQPRPYGPPPQNYGPPDIDALDHRYGAYYPEPKGTGLRLAGGITLGTSAPLLFAALVCLITGAGLSDGGETEAARVLLYTAAGMGLWGVLGTGGGAGMFVAGNARRRRYHAWLRQQSGEVAPPRIGWRPGAFVGPQRAGLALTLRF